MTEPAGRRRSSRFANLLLVLVALLLPLVVLEIFLRVRGADTRSWTMPNSVIGWSYVPGAHYEHVSAERCPGWKTSGHINSKGLRDREFTYEKPPGTFRILALGDSFTEAFQFDVEKTWTKLLEQRLNEGGGPRTEVINCGRSGMGTTTEWLFFESEGRKYQPDLVLLLFIPNDFQDNSERVALATAYGPYLQPSANGYVVDNGFLQSRDYRMRQWMSSLKRASYVVSAGMDRYASLRASRAAKKAGHGGGAAVNTAAREGLGPSWTEEDFLWVQDPSEEWLEAARITQEALRRLHRGALGEGAVFALVNGTTRIQVHPDEIARVAAAHPNWNLDGPQRFLAETAAESGFSYHDLVPEFRREAAARGEYLHGCAENSGEGHWNERGHQLAAQSIAKFLEGILVAAPFGIGRRLDCSRFEVEDPHESPRLTRAHAVTAELVAAHYDDLDAPYRDLWGEHLHHGLWMRGDETPEQAARALVDLVADFAEIRRGDAVADAGCGYGATARILARERSARVVGYTVSRAQAQWAQSRSSTPADPRVVLGDWLANEIPSQSQDAVLAIESVEHMIDREAFFRQAYRVLRPAGRIVLCAWLAGEKAPTWARRHLLEPIVREGRLAALPTAHEHEESLARAGFDAIERRDLTRNVRRTWSVCLMRLASRALGDRAFRRRFLSQSNEGRAFAAAIPRIWIAYRIGAMRYEIIRARKPAA